MAQSTPVVQPPYVGQSSPPARRIKPGRWLYVLAAGLALIGVLLIPLSIRAVASTIPGDADKFVAPGRTEITLTQPGTYTLDYEYQTFLRGRAFNTPNSIPPMDIRIASSATGDVVPMKASTGYSYQVGGTQGMSVAEFTINDPGKYIVESSYTDSESGPDIVFAVAQGAPGGLLGGILGILGALAALLAAGILALVTFIFRYSNRRRPQPVAGTGPGPEGGPA